MLPATSKANGTCLGVPDVCQVPAPPAPPIPTPFPNTAMVANATGTSTKVKIENMDVVVETSEIPSSNGDEAGTIGGVVSGTVAQKVVFKLGSSKVKAEGKAMAFLTGVTAHNGASANMPAGLQIAPSQAIPTITEAELLIARLSGMRRKNCCMGVATDPAPIPSSPAAIPVIIPMDAEMDLSSVV